MTSRRISLSDSRRIQDRAACPVPGADFDQQRELLAARSDAVCASWFERTSDRKLSDGWNGALNGRERNGAVGRKRRNSAQQALRIRMSGCVEDIGFGAQFDQVPGVHHGDAIGNVRNNGEIVRDEEHRQSKFVAEIIEQIENLLLDGNIERGGGLVGDQQLRTVDDGHSDHDALAHASGELVRIAARTLFGVGDGNILHAFDRSPPSLGFGDLVVSQHRFRDLLADAHDRIERGHGLLKNHRNARAAELTKLIRRQSGEMRGDRVAILKSDLARDYGGWRQETHDGKGGNGLSRARFADQPQHFARSDRERKVANGDSGRRLVGPKGGGKRLPGTRLPEFDGQVANVKQRTHEGYGTSAGDYFLGLDSGGTIPATR